MAEKQKFPLKFKECPICKHDRHVIAEIVEELVQEGKFTPDRPMGSFAEIIIIWDPTKVTLVSPHLIRIKDICEKCGFESTVFLDRQDRPIDQATLNTIAQQALAQQKQKAR